MSLLFPILNHLFGITPPSLSTHTQKKEKTLEPKNQTLYWKFSGNYVLCGKRIWKVLQFLPDSRIVSLLSPTFRKCENQQNEHLRHHEQTMRFQIPMFFGFTFYAQQYIWECTPLTGLIQGPHCRADVRKWVREKFLIITRLSVLVPVRRIRAPRCNTYCLTGWNSDKGYMVLNC